MNITIATLGTFILIQSLTNGGPALQTEVISLYAYHAAFQNHAVGYGSSIAMVMLRFNFAFAGSSCAGRGPGYDRDPGASEQLGAFAADAGPLAPTEGSGRSRSSGWPSMSCSWSSARSSSSRSSGC